MVLPTIYISENEREPYDRYLQNVVPMNIDDDVVFFGNGEVFEKPQISIGVERKKIYKDWAVCVVQSHHHLDQLRRMKRTHEVCYLLIEGEFDYDEEGLVTIPKWVEVDGKKKRTYSPVQPTMTYNQMVKHIETITWQLGVHVRFTRSFKLTCAWLRSIAQWWQEPLSEHVSAFAYNQQFTWDGELPLIRRVTGVLPGVGWKLSNTIAERYPFPGALNEATIKELMELEGIGKKKATDVYNAWWGIGD